MGYSRKDIMEMLRTRDSLDFLCEGIIKKHLQDASFYTVRTERVMEILQRKVNRNAMPGEPVFSIYKYKDKYPVLVEFSNSKSEAIQALHFVIHHDSIKSAIMYKIFDARAIIDTFTDEKVSPRQESGFKALSVMSLS